MRIKVAVLSGVIIGNFLGIFAPSLAGAVSNSVIISELQTASATLASDEFVEIFNTTPAPISLTGWQLQYRAATMTNGTDCTKGWTTKTTLSTGAIAAGGYFLFNSTGYLVSDASFAPGLATAGTVRLINSSAVPIDSLAWGAASCGIGTSASAPAAGQSLQRRLGADGLHADNAADFVVQTVPAPKSTKYVATVIVAPSPSPSVSLTPTPTTSPTPTALALPVVTPGLGAGLAAPSMLRLNELLVDPVSPQTDAHDEYVELHNAGIVPIALENYAIVSGTHTFKLPKGTLAPDGYLAVASFDSTLTLSNTGGVANLLDPAGNVIDTAGAWGPATPDSAWAFFGDTWRWTTTPTPGAANVFTAVPTPAVAAPVDYAAVELSEMLPDPASPLTDAKDEFIEIYNPNDQPVDLTGYILKTGHNLTGQYTIAGITIPAGGYSALKASVTKLVLSNTGSSVALYAPDGTQLGVTVTYFKAGAGNSWSRLNGHWDWTGEPTPGAENVVAPLAAVAAKPASIKPAVGLKALVAGKVASAKTKAGTKVKAAKATKTTSKPLLAGTTSAGGRWLLFILAGLTLAYIIYEFRYDLRNYYYQFRGYPVGRPAPVPVVIGRGSDRTDQRPRRG